MCITFFLRFFLWKKVSWLTPYFSKMWQIYILYFNSATFFNKKHLFTNIINRNSAYTQKRSRTAYH